MFLRAGDSYHLNLHMKRQLAQMIAEMATVNDTKGLCDHIAKTQMLAKFLGMLEFSPNWNMSSSSVENMDVSLPPIKIKESIEAAWAQSRLVIVLPWVVQFLSMMKWCVRIQLKAFFACRLFSACSHLSLLWHYEKGHLFQAMSILHGYLLSSLEHQPLLPPLPTSESFLLPNQYGHAFFTVGTSVPRCRRACSCAQITHTGSSDANG